MQGDPYAQDNLGWCYKNGIGLEKDARKAVELFQKAAEQEQCANAYTNLGICYKYGIGVEKNEDEFKYWIRK